MKKILFLFLPYLIFSADKINIKAGFLQRRLTEGQKMTIIKGYTVDPAILSMKEKTIKGNNIQVYGKDNRFIKGNGAISILDKKENAIIYGDTFFYDRDLEYLEVEGVVTMEDNKNNIVIKCKKLENFGKKNLTHFQSSVRIFKKDITARSEFAIYDKKTKNLELFGFPTVYKKQDQYKSTKITINTENENIVLQGEVQGSVTQEDDTK